MPRGLSRVDRQQAGVADDRPLVEGHLPPLPADDLQGKVRLLLCGQDLEPALSVNFYVVSHRCTQ